MTAVQIVVTAVERFCAYCRQFKEDDGKFERVLHPASGTTRYRCGKCSANRRKSPAELKQLIERDAEDRKLSYQAQGRLAQRLKKEKMK